MQFSQLKVGHKGRIIRLHTGDPAYRQRLLALGLVPGTEFVIKRVAPLGDPVEIGVRGFALSLRKAEADILEVEGVEHAVK